MHWQISKAEANWADLGETKGCARRTEIFHFLYGMILYTISTIFDSRIEGILMSITLPLQQIKVGFFLFLNLSVEITSKKFSVAFQGMYIFSNECSFFLSSL